MALIKADYTAVLDQAHNENLVMFSSESFPLTNESISFYLQSPRYAQP